LGEVGSPTTVVSLPALRAALRSVEEVVTSRNDQRIDRPLLAASCPVCGHVVLWADGVSRQDAALLRSGVRQPVPLPPPGRNRCGPSAAASTVMPLVVLPADATGPLPCCGQQVSSTRTASPVGVRTPCRTTAICNGCAAADASRYGIRRPGGLTGRRRHIGLTAPAGRRVVRSMSARRGRLAAGVGRRRNLRQGPGRFRRCRPGGCPGFGHLRPACRIPPWPGSGRDRYRNRSPGRRPLVGWSQRW
jgi:hypothetical protein